MFSCLQSKFGDQSVHFGIISQVMGLGAVFLLNYTFLCFSKFLPSPPNHCHSERKPSVAFRLQLLYQLRHVLLWLRTAADQPEAAQGLGARSPGRAGGLRVQPGLVFP